MKKTIRQIIILTLLISFLSFNTFCLAQEINPVLDKLDEVAGTEGAGYTQVTENSIEYTIAKIVMVALSILGILFLILIIIAGYQWMMSGGNEETIQKAKKKIINSIIGLAIVIFSYAIAYFVQYNLYIATIN